MCSLRKNRNIICLNRSRVLREISSPWVSKETRKENPPGIIKFAKTFSRGGGLRFSGIKIGYTPMLFL